MADVKWIKLATKLPDSRKLKQIRKLPEGDTVALMWVFLMCLAGETNENGMVYFTPEIPYTDEMLANQFDMDINTVRLGLATFQRFGMIEIVDDIICLSSWEKWQAVDGMEKIREQNRIRQARFKEKQKLLASNVTSNVAVTHGNGTDIDIEKEIDIEKDNNIISDSAEPDHVPDKDAGNIKPAKSKPVKHKYGEYKNVLLTDDELQKLKTEYSDYEERIERLSSYVASTGKSYKSHYATIRNWARKDAEKPGRKEPVPAWMNKKTKFQNFKERDYDFAELEKALVNQDAPKTAGTDEDIRRRADELKKLLS